MSKDFIGIYEELYSKEFCEYVINTFEKFDEVGLTQTRKDIGREETTMSDTFMFHPPEDYPSTYTEADVHHISPHIGKEFLDSFWNIAYQQYSDEFGMLKNIGEHSIKALKVQRTRTSEGYHVWHCEHDSNAPNRVLAWILYLNDDFEAGETEFLYQSRRVSPKQGTLVLWPAGFTHTHRGNPPLNGTKYVLTGWVEF